MRKLWSHWSLAAILLAANSPVLIAQDADKPAEEKPAAEEKKAEDAKPAAEAPAAEKPAEEKKEAAPAEKPAEKPADKPADKPAEEAKPEEAAGPKAKTAVVHLNNPSGVAVHSGTGHVFVTSQQGVFRLVPGKPGKIYLEVEEFPTDQYGKGPVYDIGPLGVALWGTDRLIVADGSRKDGEELVRVYKIEDAVPGKPRKEGDAEFTLGPIAPGDASPKGEGNFYGVTVFKDAIYVTSNGDDTKGWVAKAAIADGKPGELTPTIATKEATEVDAPIAITVGTDGESLVISQGGEVNVPGDSLLTMYDAEGKLTKKFTTGLHDITGLAYGPGGKLYAVDFAWADTTQGGLFELTVEGDTCTAKKIVGLDRPTALAFDKDGGLYVTVFADPNAKPATEQEAPKEGEKPKPTGALVYFAPGSF